MPYRYLDDIATADAAFEAWGKTIEEMFISASEATLNVMVKDLNKIDSQQQILIQAEEEYRDLLLLELLQELVYRKDAEGLFLRVEKVRIEDRGNSYSLEAETYGEPIDPDKHHLLMDIKAVTLHRLQVEQTPEGWRATVVLDI